MNRDDENRSEQQYKSRIAELEGLLEQRTTELRTTQTQLIQAEKMASLGELTAGIAHEIQNPLNFVNNFSEVSMELIAEISEARSKSQESGSKNEDGESGASDEELISDILADVKQNLEKISYHGKRADSIVKGMLQHSRASNGQKEPTDINALADEYLRLAYHGLRAKDKSFNSAIQTNFAENLPKANVVPQDLGRVFLNLFTNAFYATRHKQKQDGDFKPVLEVTTEEKNGRIEVTVSDNGIGIPDAIRDKILQPFFTTKPTGEGTGLGLSLSYDIVVKGHNGSIGIESNEGEGAVFRIGFPVK